MSTDQFAGVLIWKQNWAGERGRSNAVCGAVCITNFVMQFGTPPVIRSQSRFGFPTDWVLDRSNFEFQTGTSSAIPGYR